MLGASNWMWLWGWYCPIWICMDMACPSAPFRRSRQRSYSKRPPAFEGVGEHLTVGELEHRTGWQPACQARDLHTRWRQHTGQVKGCPVALQGRIGCHDDLLDSSSLDPAQQPVDGKLLGADTVERRQPAVQDVIQSAIRAAPFQGGQVAGLLDHADQRRIAARVAAQLAQLVLRQVAALAATANALLDG